MSEAALYLVGAFCLMSILDMTRAHFEPLTIPWTGVRTVQAVVMFAVLGGAIYL